jgi:hypothetical protein
VQSLSRFPVLQMPPAVLACHRMKFCLPMILAAAGLLHASPARADEATDLASIRALYAKIDQGKPVKTESIPFAMEDDPMEGTITRRSYKDGLVAIKLSYTAGDHGGSDQSYYLDEKGVFFILVQDSSWQFAAGSTDETPKTTDTLAETRYYVRNGAIIQVLARSVTSSGGKKLAELIAKEENRKVEKDEEGPALLKRAAALAKIRTKEEAVKFFSSEG